MKPLGSISFNTTTVRTEEAVLLAIVARDNGADDDTILKDIHLIDDLLSIQRVKIIAVGQSRTKTGRLRRNSSIMDMIEGRLDQEININK